MLPILEAKKRAVRRMPLEWQQFSERAKALMLQHGLHDWEFFYDNALRRLGACWYQRRAISMSRHFIAHNGFDSSIVSNTLLHEIAHALAFLHFGERGHGKCWKHFCQQLGIAPQVCVKHPTPRTATPRYELRHRDTQEVFRVYYRKPRLRGLSQRYICGRSDTLGKLVLVELNPKKPTQIPQKRPLIP